MNRLDQSQEGVPCEQLDGQAPVPARRGFVGWCRRHPFILLGLAAAPALVALQLLVEDDNKQRKRIYAALVRAGDISAALRAHVENSDKPLPDVKSFVGESAYRDENPNPDPEEPHNVAFRIRAEGFRVAFVFDSDQGPLAAKTLFVEFAVKDKVVSHRCWSTDIKPRYLTAKCR